MKIGFKVITMFSLAIFFLALVEIRSGITNSALKATIKGQAEALIESIMGIKVNARNKHKQIGQVQVKDPKKRSHKYKHREAFRDSIRQRAKPRDTLVRPVESSQGFTKRQQSFLSLSAVQIPLEFGRLKGDETDDFNYFLQSGNVDTNIYSLFGYSTNYNKGTVNQKCWSGSYYATRNGGIAARPGMETDNTIGRWYSEGVDSYTGENYGYYYPEYTFEESIAMFKQPGDYNNAMSRGTSLYNAALKWSAAEAYDALCGDKYFTLTNWSRDNAATFVDPSTVGTGKRDMPRWYGICHGWTPASYNTRKPVNPVNLQGPLGRIHFYQDSIKALTSLKWTQGFQTLFVGSKCPYDDPKKILTDPVTGLYIEDDCFAINPASLLIILANHVGKKGKGCVHDPDPDGEIWNQGINWYKVHWYNYFTHRTTSNIDSIAIPLSQISSWNAVRALSSKFTFSDITEELNFLNFVGTNPPRQAVAAVPFCLEINEAIENYAVRSDNPRLDQDETENSCGVVYIDGNGTMVGGRWEYNYHSQFIWKEVDGQVPIDYYDQYCTNFDTMNPDDLTNLCQLASQDGRPLKCIVDKLLAMSQ